MEPRIITRAEAHARGYSDDEIYRSIRDGRLTRIARGLYLEGEVDTVDEHVVRAVAALQKLPADSVLSHVTAAAFHGLPLDGLELSTVHATRAGATGRRTPRTQVHSAALDAQFISRLNSTRVTNPARTIVDLARCLGTRDAVTLGDAALRMALTTTAELELALLEGVHRRGIGKARRAVQLMSDRSDSPGESRSRLTLGELGLPMPLVQPNVFGPDGQWIARPDFLWKAGVIGEFDGMVKYKSDAAQVVVLEKLREDRLREAGWKVVRWTWDDLARPNSILRRLQHAFARATECPSDFRVDPLPPKSPTYSDLLRAYRQGPDWNQRAIS